MRKMLSVAVCLGMFAAFAEDPVDWVNPLIGSTSGGFPFGEHAGTMPSVGVPFGSVQWVPMTRPSELGQTSFDAGDETVLGFVGTRQMAPWMGEWGQFSFQPSIGEGAPPCDILARGLRQDRARAVYSPYYSRTVLDGMTVECAATAHAAIYRLTFPEGQVPRVVMDASRDYRLKPFLKAAFAENVATGGARIESGANRVRLWNRDIVDQCRSPRLPHFKAHQTVVFSEPFVSFGTFVGGEGRDEAGYRRAEVTPDSRTCEADRAGAYVTFAPSAHGPKTVFLRLGVSLIGEREAEDNLNREIPNDDFEAVRAAGRAAWNRQLSAIEIATPRADVRTVFYTALYHALLMPREITENGRHYSAFDDAVHEGVAYTSYSLWDTYRAEHALLTLAAPERVDGMVGSLLDAYRRGGWLPKYPNPAYTGVMVGSPAEIVIAEAHAKGFRGFDAQLAYEAVRHNATVPAANDLLHSWKASGPWPGPEARAGLTRYQTIGYVACDETCESVSRTQEFGIADAAAAVLAGNLGKADDAAYFRRRSHNWTNLWNASLGLLRPRNRRGAWVTPDRRHAVGYYGADNRCYTEVDEQLAVWGVQHDLDRLFELMGGKAAAERRLDELFETRYFRRQGRCPHNNEPAHHLPYVYNRLGAPEKCGRAVRWILEECYRNEPTGLVGNDDCGQLSAWYVLSALGFYPLNPPDGTYEIGSPIVDGAVLRLGPPCKPVEFRITVRNQAKENTVVRSVRLNGRELTDRRLRHADILSGGELEFEMCRPGGRSVTTWPLPEGVAASSDYEVSVGGVKVPVALTPMPQNRIREDLRHPYSFAQFDAAGAVEVRVTHRGRTETLKLTPPCVRTFEPDGRHGALVIAANVPETDVPQPDAPGVVFVGPGLHRRDFTVLKDGETLYLAGGAWLEGSVVAKGTNVTIRGRGVVSGAPWPWANGPKAAERVNNEGRMVLVSGRDVVVRDVTLWSSWGWCLVFNNVERGLVENVKILGGRVINDDGIDICRAKDVTIRDSFVRAQDDCIAVKWHCEDLTVTNCTLWTDIANAVRIGYECERPPTAMRNLRFTDIDVPWLTMEPKPPEAYWSNVALMLQASNDQTIERVTFDDVRFHHAEETDLLLSVKTLSIKGRTFAFPNAGTVKDVTLSNIRLPKTVGGMGVWLEAKDAAHPIDGVGLSGICNLGPVRVQGEVRRIEGVKSVWRKANP